MIFRDMLQLLPALETAILDVMYFIMFASKSKISANGNLQNDRLTVLTVAPE